MLALHPPFFLCTSTILKQQKIKGKGAVVSGVSIFKSWASQNKALKELLQLHGILLKSVRHPSIISQNIFIRLLLSSLILRYRRFLLCDWCCIILAFDLHALPSGRQRRCDSVGGGRWTLGSFFLGFLLLTLFPHLVLDPTQRAFLLLSSSCRATLIA
jgi:hypothetical protein